MGQVVGIIGSLREKSYHRLIFNQYKDMAKDSFDLVEAPIGEIPMFNQDVLDSDGLPASVSSVVDQIRQAQGVIFFSPEYNYSVPGVLKNALDWISRADDQPLNGKPSAIIGASPGNIGTARMQYHLRQIAVFLNMNVLNKPEVMISRVMEKVAEEKISDSKTEEFLKKHIAVFAKFAEKW